MRMEKSKFKIKVNLTYGLIVIIPIAVIVIVIVRLVEVLDIVAKSIGLDSTFGAGVAIIIALIILLFICYWLGLLVRTQIGSWTFERVEQTLLNQIPGYKIISSALKGFAHDKIEEYRPALIQVGAPGTNSMGFVMEENDNDTYTVFVPSTPVLTVGNVYIIDQERVTFLETNYRDIVSCITDWGMGSKKILGKSLLPDKETQADTPVNEQ